MGLFGTPKMHADCQACGRRFWMEAKNVPRIVYCPYCREEHAITGLKR